MTKYVPGPGGRFTAKAEVISGTENDPDPKVCRVLEISGPLAKTAARGSGTPQAKMRDFLLKGEPSLELSFAAGHVIGDNIGGPNSTWNLVPMSIDFNNSGGWKKMELRIAACLSSVTASMKVNIAYYVTPPRQYVPKSITVNLTFNGKKKPPIEFNGVISADSREFGNYGCLDDWT
jgi:hypothetical protein